MAIDRDAPAAGGTGGAATEAELHEVVRAILRAEGLELWADECWPSELERHQEMAAQFGDRYLNSHSIMTDAFRHARIAIAAAAARAPSPAEAEVRVLREEVEHLQASLIAAREAKAAALSFFHDAEDRATAAEADAARVRDVLRRVLQWSRQRCPCENEKPDPCPLCGEKVDGGTCRAIDKSFPDALRGDIAAALVDHAPTSAGSASANDGMQSPATPTSDGDGHGRG